MGRRCILLEPFLECLVRVVWKCPAPINANDAVQNLLHRGCAQKGIHDSGHDCCQPPHEVGACEGNFARPGDLFPIPYPRVLDDVSDPYSRRTGNLAALAIEAVFQCLVIVGTILQSQPFSVRTGLLRSGVGRICRHDRAVDRADRTFEALLKVVIVHLVDFHLFPCF